MHSIVEKLFKKHIKNNNKIFQTKFTKYDSMVSKMELTIDEISMNMCSMNNIIGPGLETNI